MSAAYACASAPARHSAAQQPRQIEIVTTRAQRKARPKAFFGLVAVVAVFGLLLVKLLLSIVVSDGAYQISSLQAEQKQLSRTEAALSEQLDLLASPQSLATRAESLGMVIGTNAPVFLRLSDGALAGTPTAASGSVGALGAGGGLVPNALLVESDFASSTLVSDVSSGASTGAPAAGTTTASVPSNGGSLPSPQTR